MVGSLAFEVVVAVHGITKTASYSMIHQGFVYSSYISNIPAPKSLLSLEITKAVSSAICLLTAVVCRFTVSARVATCRDKSVCEN